MANTVLLFGHTDKQLQSMAIQQDFDGSMARKEIKRRKMVGYCDGTAIEYVDPKAKFDELESKVGQITINGVVQ
tara:strand:+ start:230 stop:451 length:222 start_codon:yes stop_codon:yes gene_type:complete